MQLLTVYVELVRSLPGLCDRNLFRAFADLLDFIRRRRPATEVLDISTLDFDNSQVWTVSPNISKILVTETSGDMNKFRR
jgi:hypothetical protein